MFDYKGIKMNYDSLNYNSYEDEPDYFTIGTLISLCKQYSNFKFNHFLYNCLPCV